MPEIRSAGRRQKGTPAQAGAPAGADHRGDGGGTTANPDARNGRVRQGLSDEQSYGHIDFIPWERMDTLYAAVVQATEEAARSPTVT